MTRVIAGEARGRRLAVPAGQRTRPTSDRAREGLFNTLGPLHGKRVLDLYAGSGAVGLEALSRGASQVTLVEYQPLALRTIAANVASVGLPGAEVAAERVERFLGRPARTPYQVVFADPPYALPETDITTMLNSLTHHRWLAPGAVVVVERATRDGELTWPDGYVPDKARRYGEATFWYGHAEDPSV